MIRKDKSDDNYVLVDYEDILFGAVKASGLGLQELSTNFMILFETDSKEKKEDGSYVEMKKYRRIEKDSEEIKFLIEKARVIDNRTLITADILKDALIRSYYEFNHEMKNKLTGYFRKYVDNEINGIPNNVLEEEIRNDKILLEYIKKYDSFNEYLEDKINQTIDINEKIKKRR